MEASLERVLWACVCVWHVNFHIIFAKHGNCVQLSHVVHWLLNQRWELNEHTSDTIKYIDKYTKSREKNQFNFKIFEFSTVFFLFLQLIQLKWFSSECLSFRRPTLKIKFKMKSRNEKKADTHMRHWRSWQLNLSTVFSAIAVQTLPWSQTEKNSICVWEEKNLRLKILQMHKISLLLYPLYISRLIQTPYAFAQHHLALGYLVRYTLFVICNKQTLRQLGQLP